MSIRDRVSICSRLFLQITGIPVLVLSLTCANSQASVIGSKKSAPSPEVASPSGDSSLVVSEADAASSGETANVNEAPKEEKKIKPEYVCPAAFSGTRTEGVLAVFEKVYQAISNKEIDDLMIRIAMTDLAERASFIEIGPQAIPKIEVKDIVLQIEKKKTKYVEEAKPESLPKIKSVEIKNLKDFRSVVAWYVGSLEKYSKGALKIYDKNKKNSELGITEEEITEAKVLLEFYHDFLATLQSGDLDELLTRNLRKLHFQGFTPSVSQFAHMLLNEWILDHKNYDSLVEADDPAISKSFISRKIDSVRKTFTRFKKGYKKGFTKELFEKSGPRVFRWTIATSIQVFFMSAILMNSTAPEIALYQREVTQIESLLEAGRPDPAYAGAKEIEWNDKDVIQQSKRFRETVGVAKDRIKGKILSQDQIPGSILKIVTTNDSKTIRDEITSVRIPELKKATRQGDKEAIQNRKEELVTAIGDYWMSSLTNDPTIFGPIRVERDYEKELERVYSWCNEFPELDLRSSIDDELNVRMQMERNALLELLGIIKKQTD